MTEGATVSVIVLGYGAEPWLRECLSAVLSQGPALLECVLVDNGITGDVAAAVPDDERMRVVVPGANLGFAGGCNEGARQARGSVLVFVNSDAVLQPGAVDALVTAVGDPAVGLVTGSVRLSDRPETVNAAGNPMHYLGYTWSGGMGDPAADHAARCEVTCISGATFACRREMWDHLGGFDPEYFAYMEDVDLSIRTWQSGHSVVFEPLAVSHHHYEFGRNPDKWFLLERGRLVNVLTLYEPRTRRYVIPMLVAVEAGSLLPAALQGWGGSKVAAWRWLWQNRGYVRGRARRIAAERVRGDEQILPLLSAEVLPPPELGQSVPPAANAVLRGYWRWAGRRLAAR